MKARGGVTRKGALRILPCVLVLFAAAALRSPSPPYPHPAHSLYFRVRKRESTKPSTSTCEHSRSHIEFPPGALAPSRTSLPVARGCFSHAPSARFAQSDAVLRRVLALNAAIDFVPLVAVVFGPSFLPHIHRGLTRSTSTSAARRVRARTRIRALLDEESALL